MTTITVSLKFHAIEKSWFTINFIIIINTIITTDSINTFIIIHIIFIFMIIAIVVAVFVGGGVNWAVAK